MITTYDVGSRRVLQEGEVDTVVTDHETERLDVMVTARHWRKWAPLQRHGRNGAPGVEANLRNRRRRVTLKSPQFNALLILYTKLCNNSSHVNLKSIQVRVIYVLVKLFSLYVSSHILSYH